MKKYQLLPIFFVLLCCNKYEEIGNTKYPFVMNSSLTFSGYFYKGSDNDFDYFESKWMFERNKKFKIHRKESTIDLRFPKDLNKELKIEVFKTPKIFGIIKSDTLYKSKIQ